mgnify:CR=1 FL=1
MRILICVYLAKFSLNKNSVSPYAILMVKNLGAAEHEVKKTIQV